MAVKQRKRRLKSLKHINRLSTLLALALEDVRKQEKAKNSRVVMGVWLKHNGACVACLAGSVMRFSLGIEHVICANGHHFNHLFGQRDDRHHLRALEDLRQGDVQSAALHIGLRSHVLDRCVCDYHEDSEQWHADMNTLLADLKAAGE